jgi:asparagine synthase (glutamine-hydrolysing)
MCGLTGAVWNSGGKPLAWEELDRMTRILSHRGPDDGGLFLAGRDESGQWRRLLRRQGDNFGETARMSDAGCALGHRRLSIIDLSDAGRQPLANEDETVWTVLNGEIYNYRELRDELQRQGHCFRTETDTEVIVHLYEEHGDRFVERLRGMFAIAVWDERRERLVLARDRIGQKPLVYRAEPGRILFASELKSLLCADDAPRSLNLPALDAYLLYHYVPHPEYILDGYRKLPPAHRAVYERGELTVEAFWHPP